MERNEFVRMLADEGYTEIVTVEREANGSLDEHRHSFEAKALIVKGDITLTLAGKTLAFFVGDVFHLAVDQPHAERYGAEGVSYLVGRK